MTLQQLRIAVAAAELKSVSAAAKLLNISQPNASNSLKLLEEELGFPLFHRSAAGTALTPRGMEFLAYAQQMLDIGEKILNLKNKEEVYRLHLGTVNYYAAAEPYFALCTEHLNDSKADFRYVSVSVSEGIQELVSRNLDVVVAPALKHQLAGLTRECKAADVEMSPVCRVPTVMIVRKGHPAIADGHCRSIVQGSDVMKEYPYVGFKNLEQDAGSAAYHDSDYIQSSYKLFADDTYVRLRMIESTNGFGFGLPSSHQFISRFNLEFFPVKDVYADLFCLYRQGEGEQREIREYTTLLKKEMLLMLR